MRTSAISNHLFLHFGSLLFALLLWIPHFALAEDASSQQLIRDADRFRGFPGQGFKFKLEVTSIIPGEAKRTSRMSVFVRNTDSLVRFDAPVRDRGKAMLSRTAHSGFIYPKPES